MRHLWQRIFGYTLVLMVLSQAAAFFLHKYSQDGEGARRFIAGATEALAEAVDGRTLDAAGTMVSLFGRGESRAWIVAPDGNALLGSAPEDMTDFSRADRTWHGKELDARAMESITVWQFGRDEPRFVAGVPIRLAEGGATLFVRFGRPHRPGMWPIFLQGLTGVTLVGGMLAFWMARRVSRPLRQLRDEVLEIAGGRMDKRVTLRGHDEIRDLSLAVNHMADSLAKNVRNMRELVANISHELRSPLARMQVSFTLLEEDLHGGEAERSPATAVPAGVMPRLAQLQEELEHMNQLIGTTLLSSRLDLHDAPPVDTPVVFSGLCEAMAGRHAPMFARRGLVFTSSVAEGIIMHGDETLLCTLVSNLLDNAEKYTAQGGTVRLALSREENAALLTVENTHAPVEKDALEHIFEPFNRAGAATGNGVGLGLSLVRQITHLHGGAVRADNTENGVRFSVRLPLSLAG